MSEFNHANVEKSVFKWFSESYTDGPIDIGVARTLNESTSDSWVDFQIPSVTQEPARENNKRCFEVQIIARCYGKSQTNLYAALGDAGVVGELLRNAVIPILSFDESGTPTIGHCKLTEPQMTNDTYLQDDISVDVRVIAISGYAEQS